jgi:cytochrome bd-type quinol oxidase subunit 2
MQAINDWLVEHLGTVSLVTAWSLCIGFAVLAVVEGVTFAATVRTRSVTKLGQAITWYAAAACVLSIALSVLYGATLWLYYHDDRLLTVWQETAVYALLIAGIVGACIHGTVYARHLRRLRWGHHDEPPDPPQTTISGLKPRTDKYKFWIG